MIAKLFARIRRNWPLVTRARLNRVMAVRDKVYAEYGRQLDRTRVERNHAEGLAKAAIAQAADAITKIDHARGQCDRAKQEAEENRRHATAMQLRLTELMRAYRTASGSVGFNWELLATSIIRQAHDGEGNRVYACVYRKPSLSRPTGPYGQTGTVSYDLHRFGMEIGMSPDTPPELVAGQIADSVRAFILENWRTQSLLLAKETP